MEKKFSGFMRRNNLFILLCIVVIAVGVFLRFYQLGAVPNSLNWDEVSWGYNAYSILHTGKDEYGSTLPLSFRAFGDYKQPLYIYASVLPIALFDLAPFSARLPSAFFGSLSMIVVYLLTYELLIAYKKKKIIALLAMSFFAISPWSIHFSRVSYEANVGVFLVVLGSWLFLRGINTRRNVFLFTGIVALALSAYTYHSDKLFAPIIVVLLSLYSWKFFIVRKKLLVLLLFFFALCNIFWVTDSRTTERGRGVLFTANQTPILEVPLKRMLYDQSVGDTVGMQLHNRRIVYVQHYFTNYLSHFDPNWLFMKGDNQRHHTPGMGLLYFGNIFFILFGIYQLLKKHTNTGLFLLGWMLSAPLASSLAVDAPNASRALNFLPTWHIFEAVGWWYTYVLLSRTKWKYVLVIPLLILIGNIVYFYHQNFVHTNTDTQKEWQYGYKEAILSLKDEKEKRIVFSKTFEQPYIFYLFYMHYNPEKYLQEGGSERIRKKCFSIDNAFFGDCQNQLRKGDYFVSIENEMLPNTKAEKTIPYADGRPAIKISRYE